MLKKAKKWIGYNFQYGHWDNPPREGTDENDEMKQFFRDFRSDLRDALKKVRLKIYRMKPNYYNVTAVISDPEETHFVYLSIGDMRYEKFWNERILIRTMAHAQDWTGGGNHWTDTEHLIDEIAWLMERTHAA